MGEQSHGEKSIIAGSQSTKHTIRFSDIPRKLAAELEHLLNNRQRTLSHRAEEQGLEFQEASCNCWTCIVGDRQFGDKSCPCCNCSYPVGDGAEGEGDWYEDYMGEEFDPDDEVWKWDFVPRECWRAPGGYCIRLDVEEVGEIRRVVVKERKEPKKRWGGRAPKWARKLVIYVI